MPVLSDHDGPQLAGTAALAPSLTWLLQCCRTFATSSTFEVCREVLGNYSQCQKEEGNNSSE